jgi:hypothetical protein
LKLKLGEERGVRRAGEGGGNRGIGTNLSRNSRTRTINSIKTSPQTN